MKYYQFHILMHALDHCLIICHLSGRPVQNDSNCRIHLESQACASFKVPID
jgi:hypothetical protein